jgi:hypothetical protein
MRKKENASAFGQADPTDGREPLEWPSRYDPAARKEIQLEAFYLGLLLFALPIAMVVLWLEYPKNWFHLSDQKYSPILKYGFAWAAGTLGGTLFDWKWLYHSVARQIWHMDRRLWRIFTPHISGSLAFAVIALVGSGVIRVFDSRATEAHTVVVGFGFLVGYFSDSAIAKLTEVADTLFGTVYAKERHREPTVANVDVLMEKGPPKPDD